MNAILIPALQIETARRGFASHLGHAPQTEAEVALDTLLHALADEARPAHELTKAALAELVERTLADATPAVCACGHEFADHLGSAGCLECVSCTARRPHATEVAPAVLPVGTVVQNVAGRVVGRVVAVGACDGEDCDGDRKVLPLDASSDADPLCYPVASLKPATA